MIINDCQVEHKENRFWSKLMFLQYISYLIMPKELSKMEHFGIPDNFGDYLGPSRV
jgi:hypothetical protein